MQHYRAGDLSRCPGFSVATMPPCASNIYKCSLISCLLDFKTMVLSVRLYSNEAKQGLGLLLAWSFTSSRQKRVCPRVCPHLLACRFCAADQFRPALTSSLPVAKQTITLTRADIDVNKRY